MVFATMEIALITTIDHNVGDDFVRLGLQFLLRQVFSKEQLYFNLIHKHAPLSSRLIFKSVRNAFWGKWIDGMLPVAWTQDVLRRADLIIQCGAPTAWCHPSCHSHSYQNEWFKNLIVRRKISRHQFWNIGGGSCMKYHQDDGVLCERCQRYILELTSSAQKTIIRDRVILKMYQSLGYEIPHGPCPSLFCSEALNERPPAGQYVVINYMPHGGHYTYGQKIDHKKWRNTLLQFYMLLRQQERVVFIAHDHSEATVTRQYFPDAEIFNGEKNPLATLKMYAAAKYGFVNRVHGALAMASFGIPSFVIGSDTRSTMIENFDLKHQFVGDIELNDLLREWKNLQARQTNYQQTITELKDTTLKNYIQWLTKP